MASTAGSQDKVAFALRTHDATWIKRNNATITDDGLVIIMVPASEITMQTATIAGRPLVKLTRKFADCPKDFPNPWIVSFGDWVPETVARLQAMQD